MPELKQRTQVDTLEIDGGSTGPEASQVCAQQGVTLNLSAIHGRTPNPAHLGLDAFTWDTTSGTTPCVTCPYGQTVDLTPGRKAHRCQAAFDAIVCAQCPLVESCPTRPRKRHPQRVLNVDQRQIEVAQLRQRCAPQRVQQATTIYALPSKVRCAASSTPSVDSAASYRSAAKRGSRWSSSLRH